MLISLIPLGNKVLKPVYRKKGQLEKLQTADISSLRPTKERTDSNSRIHDGVESFLDSSI